MASVKVRIEMDQGFVFWPESEDAEGTKNSPMTLEIDDEFLKNYDAVAEVFYEMHDQLEQMWRLQEGKSVDANPFKKLPVIRQL